MEQPCNFDANNLAEAIMLLDWSDDTCNELRCLGNRNLGWKHATISGYFTDPGLMIDAAAKWSGRVEGVYVVLNPPIRRLLARSANRLNPYAKHTTKDSEVARRRWLFVDLDPTRPAGLSSTDEEHERAVQCARRIFDDLHARDPGKRLVLASSGNGGHILAEFNYPNDDTATARAQHVLVAIANQFSDLLTHNGIELDTTTHNAARLCKLYGTMACKGDPIDGNVHRLSRILEDTDVRG